MSRARGREGGGKRRGQGRGRGQKRGDHCAVKRDLELKGGREGTLQHGPGAILEGAIGSCRDRDRDRSRDRDSRCYPPWPLCLAWRLWLLLCAGFAMIPRWWRIVGRSMFSGKWGRRNFGISSKPEFR